MSGITIRNQARILFNEVYQNSEESSVEFQASNGWFINFCKRHRYTLRRITTTGRELPSNSIEIIKKFLSDFQRITSSFGFSRDQIVNMDETAIYLDNPSNYK